MNEEGKSYNDLKTYIKNGIINMYRVIYIIIRKEEARAIELAKNYDTVWKVTAEHKDQKRDSLYAKLLSR